MRQNLILDTDSYKASHYLQYPPGTTGMFSYIESRGGRYERTVFFGLQYLVQEYLTRPIEPWMVDEAEVFFQTHGVPFNAQGWRYIAQDLGGRLPIKIRAVAEGTVIPTQNVLITLEATDPATFWLVSWLETMLLRVWYPITVATQSWHLRQILQGYLEKTAADPQAEIGFKLHDFGSRGVSSAETAGIGGMAHLVNFQGSDTVLGVRFANYYYRHPMAAYSVPAAEHSTITSWGKDGEVLAYQNMLQHFAQPGRVLAVVSDSYDLWYAAETLWGDQLRQQVIDSGATIVIRPDSGDPPTVVLKLLEILAARFGTVINAKGYKVLNHVRVIQGDGIDETSLKEILERITQQGFSTTNIAFGMGGALLQQVNRDTQRFAMKCSEVTIHDQRVPVYKDPVTDPGKKSKRGRLDLIYQDGRYQTVPATPESAAFSVLGTVFENGQLLKVHTLEEIRQRAWG